VVLVSFIANLQLEEGEEEEFFNHCKERPREARGGLCASSSPGIRVARSGDASVDAHHVKRTFILRAMGWCKRAGWTAAELF